MRLQQSPSIPAIATFTLHSYRKALHYTDCGITRLAKDSAMLAHFFQIPEPEVKPKAVTDPQAAVAGDVALLRSIPSLPGRWLLSGLVYDVATGLVKTVVPPAPIRAL